jgi:hypothetical protein
MISDLSAKILNAWADLAGVNPNATSYNSSSYVDTKKIQHAAKGLELDPSGISTAMLAHGFYSGHVGATKFSLSDLLDPSPDIKALLEKTRGFKTLLDDQGVAEAVQGFKDSITKALSHYEVEIKGDLESLIQSNVDMAEMRLSALNSINELRMDQFLRGEPEKPGVNPVFMKSIFKWWNINSLLAAAVKMPSGISLHMIGTPKTFDTFFVFLIRNGGNLYILSDVAKEPHPLYSGSTRRPDRKFNDRVNQNWFPYELADVEWVEGEEEDEWQLYQTASKARDLVTYQHESRPLSAINKLEPQPTVWLSMMFSLIMKRFWGSDEQAQELSYTGEMVLNSQALLQRATLANLPMVVTSAFEAAVIDQAMISTEVATEEGIGETYNMTTAWMIERYSDKVDDEVLNLTASKDKDIALVLTHEGIVKVQPDEEQKKDLRVAESYPYPVTRFGSATNLENDRKFLARSNFAESISLLAQAEFKARRAEIEQWYAQAVQRNLDNLIALSGSESIWIDDGEKTGLDITTKNNRAACRSNGGRLFHRFMGRVDVNSNHNFWPALMLYQSHNGYNAKCNVTGAKASYLIGFTPANAKELAIVAGCEVSELPDVLQHWTVRRHRAGNAITDRIDPMSWRLKDPWEEVVFGVNLALSKRGLAQVQKSPKLPPLQIATEEQMKHSSYTVSIFG